MKKAVTMRQRVLHWIVTPETETVTVYDFEHGKEAMKYDFFEDIFF